MSVSKSLKSLKADGFRSWAYSGLREFANRNNPFRQGPLAFVYSEDAIGVDWTVPANFNKFASPAGTGRYKVAWIISPPGRTSGGHQNAFRFMKVLEDAGHELTIYLYSPAKYPVVNPDAVREMLDETSAYPDLNADIKVYSPDDGIEGVFHAIFASDWGTAYAAFRYPGQAKRLYFTQDFEPWFFSRGTDYVLAENTYRFGFYGISAGKWLAEKLSKDFAMPGGYYQYGVDSKKYHRVNTARRHEILFYARPPTARRATEFGLLALEELHNLRPDITINLVGWDMSNFDVPFPYVNNSALDISQLNAVYNRCAAGLALSLTNLSLLPMELMAAGVVPLVNDAENTRTILESPHVGFVPMSPRAIANRLIQEVNREDQQAHSKVIAESVNSSEWSDPAAMFLKEFEFCMKNVT